MHRNSVLTVSAKKRLVPAGAPKPSLLSDFMICAQRYSRHLKQISAKLARLSRAVGAHSGIPRRTLEARLREARLGTWWISTLGRWTPDSMRGMRVETCNRTIAEQSSRKRVGKYENSYDCRRCRRHFRARVDVERRTRLRPTATAAASGLACWVDWQRAPSSAGQLPTRRVRRLTQWFQVTRPIRPMRPPRRSAVRADIGHDDRCSTNGAMWSAIRVRASSVRSRISG